MAWFAPMGPRMMYGLGPHVLGFAGAAFTLLLLAVGVALLVAAATSRRTHGSGSVPPGAPISGTSTVVHPPEDATREAVRIAAERLARGEIDVEQYESIVRTLRGS